MTTQLPQQEIEHICKSHERIWRYLARVSMIRALLRECEDMPNDVTLKIMEVRQAVEDDYQSYIKSL